MLKLIKSIARIVTPNDYDFYQVVGRIRDDVRGGLRVGFFIQGKPYVASLNKETNEIELKPLEE